MFYTGMAGTTRDSSCRSNWGDPNSMLDHAHTELDCALLTVNAARDAFYEMKSARAIDSHPDDPNEEVYSPAPVATPSIKVMDAGARSLLRRSRR